TLPVAGATAYDLGHPVAPEAGGTVLVVGAGGGVGLMAAQVAAARGLAVIGVASEGKRRLVEGKGATFVPSGAGLADRLREVAPAGVDPVVDLVGGDVLREAAAAELGRASCTAKR